MLRPKLFSDMNSVRTIGSDLSPEFVMQQESLCSDAFTTTRTSPKRSGERWFSSRRQDVTYESSCRDFFVLHVCLHSTSSPAHQHKPWPLSPKAHLQHAHSTVNVSDNLLLWSQRAHLFIIVVGRRNSKECPVQTFEFWHTAPPDNVRRL